MDRKDKKLNFLPLCTAIEGSRVSNYFLLSLLPVAMEFALNCLHPTELRDGLITPTLKTY